MNTLEILELEKLKRKRLIDEFNADPYDNLEIGRVLSELKDIEEAIIILKERRNER